MPQKGILTESRYAKLLKDIRGFIEEGRRRAAQSARQELVETYWQIGKRICDEGLIENAGYGDAVLADVSDDLDVDLSTLKRCVNFFQTYNSAPRGTNLTWSHYRALLPVKDDAERQWYEDLTENDGLNVPLLSKAIKEDRYGWSRKKAGARHAVPLLKRPSEATYVYKAIVERVIDGDTLLLRIDLGFQVWKEQRVRLAEIDAPAMDEPKGRDAYKYVLNQLSKVDFVMVKTNKIDVYGRYVGHIFYSFKNLGKSEIFSKGRYLNQELVQKQLAKVF